MSQLRSAKWAFNYHKLKNVPHPIKAIRDAILERQEMIDKDPKIIPAPNPILDCVFMQARALKNSSTFDNPSINVPKWRAHEFLGTAKFMNVDLLPNLNNKTLPATTEHACLDIGILRPDVYDLEPLKQNFELHRYTSKWWALSSTKYGFSSRAVTIHKKMVLTSCSLNEYLNPIEVLKQPFIDSYDLQSFVDSNEARLMKHAEDNKYCLPFYINFFGAPDMNLNTERSSRPFLDRFVECVSKLNKKGSAHYYNIEQLRTPLPSQISSQLKEFYSAEEKRLESEGQVSEACIDGESGDSLASDELLQSHFPTKIFFTTESLIKLKLKILPNAIPTRASEILRKMKFINIEEYENQLEILARFGRAYAYNDGIPWKDQVPPYLKSTHVGLKN